MKTCNKCFTEKPLSEYDKNKHCKGGLKHECRVCWRAYAKAYYEQNKDKKLAQRKAWYDANPEYNRNLYLKNKTRFRDTQLKKDFGITLVDYAEMLKDQSLKCAICKSLQGNKAFAVDHDHKTGQIRGLLCSNCNVGVGMFRDSPELLIKAVDYLRK